MDEMRDIMQRVIALERKVARLEAAGKDSPLDPERMKIPTKRNSKASSKTDARMVAYDDETGRLSIWTGSEWVEVGG